MPKVAVIVGSIRKDSINKKLAAALQRLGEGKIEFDRVRIDDLPLFNQDDEASPTPEVARIKAQIAAADAVLFVTPEHNRSIPAAMKNAIDWATRPPAQSAFKGKWAAAIIGTSRGRISTAVAQQHLRVIVSGHFDALLGRPEAYVQFTDGLIDDAGNISDEKTQKFLQTFIDRFAELVTAVPRNEPL
jgi:chromate reductase, NAD(P)H dehydrogenase (quinone)